MPAGDMPAPGPPPGPDGGPGTDLDRLEIISRRLQSISQHGARTRKLTRLCIACLAVVAVLAGITTWIAVNNTDQEDQLRAQAMTIHAQQAAVHASQLNACRIGNQARVDQIRLWGFFLQLAAQSPKSDPVAISELRQFVGKTFQQVDCAKLYPQVNPGPGARAAAPPGGKNEAVPAFPAGRMRPAP